MLLLDLIKTICIEDKLCSLFLAQKIIFTNDLKNDT